MKVTMGFEPVKGGEATASVVGGELDGETLYVGDGAKSRKGVRELEFGKRKIQGLPGRQQMEIQRVLQEAYARGIPVEHLPLNLLNIPGVRTLYEEMTHDAETNEETSVKLPPGSMFAVNPTSEPKKREIWYIAGAAGSGKSYTAKRLVEQYQKRFPERDVFLVSKLEKDATLDSLKKPLIRLKPSKLTENPMTDTEPLRESLIIFDDYDGLEKKELKAVEQLIKDICIVGRHTVTSMIVISHYLSDYARTRLTLTEATHFVLFPKSTGSHALSHFLQKYVGMDTKEINRVKRNDSRWFCVHKNFPMFAVTENEAYLLNQPQELDERK